MITPAIANAIESSVLCWLATVSEDGCPNVSPKEAFLLDRDGKILIAHIASPQTVRNIRNEPKVCVSFIDVFTQKGYKIKGTAAILTERHERYARQDSLLKKIIGETFHILAVIEVQPTAVEEIIAPSYRVIPGTTEKKMIRQSLETYRVAEYQAKAAAPENPTT